MIPYQKKIEDCKETLFSVDAGLTQTMGAIGNRPMPTNVLLISGPSKTADIEQTLVYGIHGPKQLILFLIR